MKIASKQKIGSIPKVPKGTTYRKDPTNQTQAVLYAYTLAIKLKEPLVLVPNNNKGHRVYQIARVTDSLLKYGIVIPRGESIELNMVDPSGIIYRITASK